MNQFINKIIGRLIANENRMQTYSTLIIIMAMLNLHATMNINSAEPYLALRLHSNHMSTFHHYLIHWFVQHVGSSVDCTQSKMTSE